MSEQQGYCACLNVVYNPKDVEHVNPINPDGAPIKSKAERWVCAECGAEFTRSLFHRAVVSQLHDRIAELEAAQSWQPIESAPMYVNGKDALVGEYTPIGWKKVSIWEPSWTREDCVKRGVTHWWPNLRDLPKPPTGEGQ